jgi:glyoxylase-like metal-dependent hydrolase (beta-lactamase superfamily II)
MRPSIPAGLVWLEPLTPAFPSSCNSFAVREDDGGWTWIDPGAAGDANTKRTRAELERHGLDLGDLRRILVTHPHVDHLGAAALLRGQGVAAPVLCHPDAVALAATLDAMMASFDFELARERFGDVRAEVEAYTARMRRIIFHGGAPFVPVEARGELVDGTIVETGPFRWRCVLTPGHCPGHVALFAEEHGVLVAGDVVGHNLAWHSPSSGGARAYLESLDRLERLGASLLLPAHGDPIDDPARSIGHMRERLLERESRVVDALGGGASPYAEIYAAVTKDGARSRLFPFVPMLEGHLQRLCALGAISEVEPGVFARAG